MVQVKKILPEDYNYILPPERIARYPEEQRDASRLLVYKNGEVSGDVFRNVPFHIPSGSVMLRNETRVIRARLIFRKSTGARIEVFCLEPCGEITDYQKVMSSRAPVSWKCLVGNARKWKQEKLSLPVLAGGKSTQFHAEKLGRQGNAFCVRFSWDNDALSFGELMEGAGFVPLPPYLNRNEVEGDRERYQTIYARNAGSVAAPTAGLHFTEGVVQRLQAKNIVFRDVTLHVGAGTFKPVSSAHLGGHEMHTEKIWLERDLIEKLSCETGRPWVSVGTTTLRALESMYWYGVKYLADGVLDPVHVSQWESYEKYAGQHVSVKEALRGLAEFMKAGGRKSMEATTQLLIVPGYRIRMAEALITNFHMPKSTLLMLVAAFIGKDWEKAYRYALDKGFRFLSYGDGCLFWKDTEGPDK
ncbi:MAG: S-adenosylmethionine:tRNA ribosyltransferase-isomerase [Bacteroidales bacterium]